MFWRSTINDLQYTLRLKVLASLDIEKKKTNRMKYLSSFSSIFETIKVAFKGLDQTIKPQPM